MIELTAAPPSSRLAAAGDDPGSESPGAGTGRTPRRRLEGKRILIVEDEALVALDLEFAFEDEGAKIIGPALSLGDALDLVDANGTIDGAVLDVDLGGTDVYPVAEILFARGVPFVFHTGHASREMLEKRFPGSIACLKPTLPSVLIGTLLRARH